MRIGDLKPQAPKIILMGPSGCGKTALACTLGKGAKLWAFESGYITALTLKDNFATQRNEVDLAGPVYKGQSTSYVEQTPMAPAAWVRFKTDLISFSNGAILDANKPDAPRCAHIFDSLTTMFEAAMRYVMANSGKPLGNPEIQHWGIAFTEVYNMLNIIRSLPGTAILLAHTQRDEVKKNKSDKEGQQIIELAIPGKNFPSKVTAIFNEVWYMRMEQAAGNTFRRTLQTMSDPQISAKTQFQLGNNFDTNVGMTDILAKMGYVW